MNIANFVFQLFGINTYVVWDDDSLQAAVVDPGMSSAEENEAVAKFLKKNNLQLKYIINTHLHVDHVAGNKYIIDNYKVPVLANKEDMNLGKLMKRQVEAFQLPFNVADVAIDRFINDGDEIALGDKCLKVLCVPGHSRGSVALYDAEGGFVITGDALFCGSIGRTDLPGGNHAQLVESVCTKLMTLPPDTVAYPGHGGPTTIALELKYNPFVRPFLSR